MPVYVIDILAPKNNGDFPVVDDQHVLGGFHACLDHAARDAIPAQRRKTGLFAWTQDDQKLWRLDAGDVWVEVPVGSSGSASKVEKSFTFADYSSGNVLIGSVPVGRTVQSVMLFIDVAFNNGVKFTLGDAGGVARFLALIDNDPARIEMYSSDSGYTYGSDTDVRLYMSGGVPPTVGSGRVVVFYA